MGLRDMLETILKRLMPHKDSSEDSLLGWHTIYAVESPQTPYMTRFWVGRYRLHIFHTGDPGHDPHDHPWGFWTFPLTPYIEEVWSITDNEGSVGPQFASKRVLVPAWTWTYRMATHTHRVLGRHLEPATARAAWNEELRGLYLVKDGAKVVTIVVVDRTYKRRWGFLRRDDTGRFCWVPWRLYVYEGGNAAPCAEIEHKKGSQI